MGQGAAIKIVIDPDSLAPPKDETSLHSPAISSCPNPTTNPL